MFTRGYWISVLDFLLAVAGILRFDDRNRRVVNFKAKGTMFASVLSSFTLNHIMYLLGTSWHKTVDPYPVVGISHHKGQSRVMVSHGLSPTPVCPLPFLWRWASDIPIAMLGPASVLAFSCKAFCSPVA